MDINEDLKTSLAILAMASPKDFEENLELEGQDIDYEDYPKMVLFMLEIILISENAEQKIKILFDQIPILDFENDLANSFFIQIVELFMNEQFASGMEKEFQLVYDYFNRTEGEVFTFLASMYGKRIFSNEVVKFTTDKMHENLDYIMDLLIENGQEDEQNGIERLLELYPEYFEKTTENKDVIGITDIYKPENSNKYKLPENSEDEKKLDKIVSYLEKAEAYKNNYAIDALSEVYKRNAPTMEKPTYLTDQVYKINYLNEVLKVKLDPVLNLPDDSELDKLLRLTFNQIPGNTKYDENFINTLSEEDKIKIFNQNIPLLRQIVLGKDKFLHQILGPSNPLPAGDPDSDNICNKTGGCCMFECNHFLANIEDNELGIYDNERPDWFTGNCSICLLKIPYYWWAVRIPIYGGGWRGCFHSFSCARQDPYLNEKIENNIQNNNLLNEFEKTIIGQRIANRTE